MKFSKDDFTQENASRLMVIIMSKMDRPTLTQFRELPPTQQNQAQPING
jgi:hypothetical protein